MRRPFVMRANSCGSVSESTADRLADDGELALDGRAQHARRLVLVELDAGEHRDDGVAGLDDVPQVRGRRTLQRSCVGRSTQLARSAKTITPSTAAVVGELSRST